MKGARKILFLLLWAAGAFCLLVHGGPIDAREMLEGLDDGRFVHVAAIKSKSPETNYIFIGERRFRVSDTAEIIGYGARRIPLTRLPTPCRSASV